MRRWRATLLGLAISTILAATSPAAHGAQPTRTIFASVTDADGRPMRDMAAADFEVKENGRVQEIEVRPATTPLRVALIVSDRGGGQFQVGALRFCEALLGYGEISIVGVAVQSETLNDYSGSADNLRGALQRLGRRAAGASHTGAQLVEAIYEVSKTIRREGRRSAIVVMRTGGEALTPITWEAVRASLRSSGAVLNVVSTSGADRGSSSWPDGYGESRLVVPSVLGDGSRESGGRHLQVVANTMVPVMQRVAAELMNQYEITYTAPAETKPTDRVSVTSKRKGVNARAAIWPN